MNYKQQNISNATKEGYSKKALEALTKGTYKQTREGSVASYKRQQARQKQSVPSLNKGTAYQNNVQNNAQKYQYNEAAKKANTLSKEDLKFMDDLYQNFDMGGNMASVLKASGKTAGWEKKYGKSYKQIVDDYEADRKNRVMEQGEKHHVLSALGTVGSKTLQTPFEAVGDFLTKVTSPGSDNAKYADYIRGREEEDIKLKRAGIKEHTGEIGDKVIDTALPIADRMAVSSFDKLLKTGGLFTGLSDYSNYMEDLNQRPGMNDRRKALSALAHGTVEGAGTAITRGALDKIPAVEGVGGKILNMAKGGGNAAIENFISELIEMGSDTAINKENSQKELNKAFYMAQGMTEGEATRQARIDQAKQAGMAGLTGFLFGAGTKGISEGFDAIKKIPALKGIFGGKTNAPEADDPVIANATKQAEQAVEEIDTLKQQIPETPETAPANDIKLVRNKETGEYSYENFRVVKDGKQNYAIIDPEGNTVGNARTLKDAKSMIADTRSDVALEDTGIERNPTITETVGETAPVEVDPENVIYHAGKLSKYNKADTAGKMEGTRGTGYYGTGHYFVDQAHRGEIGEGSGYGDKPYSSVDISKYENLYKADTDAKANKLHDFSKKLMRYVNGYADDRFTDSEGVDPDKLQEYMDEAYTDYKDLFGDKSMSRAEFEDRLNQFRNEYEYDFSDRGDSAFTTFMKEHGYNGVDTRGTRSADTERGVVIYDLDEDSVLQSNVTDAETKAGLMNTRVRNGQPVFDEEIDARLEKEIKSSEKKRQIRKEYLNLYDEQNLKNINKELDEANMYLENNRNAIEEYKAILSNEEAFEQEVEDFIRFQRKIDDDLVFDGDEAREFVRETTQEHLQDSTERVAQLEERIKQLQSELETEEAASKAAYAQARANVKGISEEAVDSAVEQTANEVPPEPGEEKIRSFSMRGSMDEELPEEIRNTLSEDMYRVVRNAETSARADELFDPNNLAQTRSNLKQAIDSHDPASALLSYKLAKAYVDAGEYDAATDVLEEVSAELTRMGQFTQAAKLAMMQNDPMAAMRSYERDLQKLNQWGKKKYKKKWNDLKLDKEDIDLFNKVQKGDKEGLNEVVNQLNAKFGKKVPSTWWDKLVGATKTAMLLNFRTQSRNILANVATLPMRSASDRVSALGQNIVHLFNKDFEVNQSLLGGTKEQKKIAAQIFENSKNEIVGENKMKDSVKSDILSHKQTFNNDFLAKWIDNQTNGGIQRLNEYFGADANTSTMETLQNLTYWLMGDVGDTPFVKKNFVNRLASYMKAQGINNIEDVPDEAVAIATQEALKATFKDDNAFSKALQGVKQKTGKFGEVALPFVKTPANLTMRAVDYSPAGIINTIRKARSGAELNDVIDDLSKNLTGTALIYLGYKLAEKGIISGAYSADKDEASFQKQQGMLEYSFHIPDDVPVIGGNYYSYDWSQPASTPLVIGTTIYEAIKNSDKENNEIKDIVNGVYRGGLNVTNTIINSSPLQSLSDILGSDGTDEGGVAGNIANEIMEFPQRLIPSILGATARTIDPTIRDTYVSDNTLTGTLGNQLRSAQAKIPFLSETLPASYDTWGNERKRSDSVGEAFVAQMVNPGQVGNKNITPIDDEIQKIYDETGNAAVFPLNAARKLDLGSDGNITLTNKQHSDYQRLMGQTSYKFAENLINNEDFQSLSSDEKAATLESVYKLSNELAKEELFNHTTDSNKELKEIARTGDAEAVTQYLMDKQKAKSLDMDVRTYREKEAEQPGGAVQYAETKQEAVDNGFVTKDGNANVKQYEKVLEQAGQYSDKVLNDLPILESSGLKPSAYYYYAKAVNVLPSLTPNEFATTYKAIDTDPDNAMTQKEVLAYLNKGNYTDQQANQLWLMYAPEGKKLPYLKKDGTWGAK